MKKILLLILMLLIFCPLSFGEEIPPNGCGYAITKETNPIYWGYMEDYAAQLKKALEAKRMFRLRYMGASYKLVITRDGEIKDMKISTYQNEYFNRKVKEIILSVPPIPFREGMNVNEMLFSIYLGFEPYEETALSIGGTTDKRDIFHIRILTDK